MRFRARCAQEGSPDIYTFGLQDSRFGKVQWQWTLQGTPGGEAPVQKLREHRPEMEKEIRYDPRIFVRMRVDMGHDAEHVARMPGTCENNGIRIGEQIERCLCAVVKLQSFGLESA